MARRGPDGVQFFLGIFYLLFGSALLLAGGGCTVLMWRELPRLIHGPGRGLGWFTLIITIFALAAGISSIWAAFKFLRGTDG